ncbi:hypothetical protein J2Z40_002141 [Cytobacillus eiseniae]|uniref:Lipoprotein n=1 Tax=Cytobacillus eiseniae TaxID=762947 RepID=A0ABS4RF95_9BACI|nr:hypothetical protein [Cytobacillus eiseniae]MBP2241578.1 hypothetical protein [Cytobacillus eiseniae]
MKKNKIYIFVALVPFLLVIFTACEGSSEQSGSRIERQSQTNEGSRVEDDLSKSMDYSSSDSLTAIPKSEEKEQEGIKTMTSETSHLHLGDKQERETLSQYSSEQIEYARVWLQLGPNQELDHLTVQHIPAGTPLNPGDEADVSYPEDVIQLTGSRIVDGIVTYSGNGDGSINVYNVPLRWYGGLTRPDHVSVDEIREEMKGMINNTKLVHVDTGDGEKIIELIKLLKVNK